MNFDDLQAAGFIVARGTFSKSHSTTIAGQTATQSSHGTSIECTLPAKARFTVTFGLESLSTKVIKWFKSEIQTDDADFDDTIYIDCGGGQELLAELLKKDAKLRYEIYSAITAGGEIVVEDRKLRWWAPGNAVPEAQIAQLALAAAGPKAA
jgi:hypothetical protein